MGLVLLVAIEKTIKMDMVEDEAIMSDVQTEDEMALATDVETTDAETTDAEATDVETTDAEITDAEATDFEAPIVPLASAGVEEESAQVPLISAGKRAPKRRRKVSKKKKTKKTKKAKKAKKGKKAKKSKKRRSKKRRAPKRKLKLREMIMIIIRSSGKKTGMSLASIMKALQSRYSVNNGFFVKQTLKWLRKKRVIRRNSKGCYVATGHKLVLGTPFGGKPNRSGRPKGSKGKKRRTRRRRKSKKSKKSKKRSRKTRKSRKTKKAGRNNRRKSVKRSTAGRKRRR